MQSGPEQTTGQFWQRWRWTLRLGVLLGVVELLLATQPWNLEQLGDLSLSGLQLGVLLYLLIPLIAGFLVANQRASVLAGIGAGCLVVYLAFLISALSVFALFYLLAPDHCQTQQPCLSPRGDSGLASSST